MSVEERLTGGEGDEEEERARNVGGCRHGGGAERHVVGWAAGGASREGHEVHCVVQPHTAQEMRRGGGDAGHTYGGSRVSGCATAPKQLHGARQLDPGDSFWMCIRGAAHARRVPTRKARERADCVCRAAGWRMLGALPNSSPRYPQQTGEKVYRKLSLCVAHRLAPRTSATTALLSAPARSASGRRTHRRVWHLLLARAFNRSPGNNTTM